MKKFLFFIVFILVCQICFGQRRNTDGLKMIKSATFVWNISVNNSPDTYGWKTNYNFVYDKNNRLQTFTLKKDYNQNGVFKECLLNAEYKKNGISSTNNGLCQYMKLEFDNNNHIKYIWDYDKMDDGTYSGFYYKMGYNEELRLVSEGLISFTTDKNRKIKYGTQTNNKTIYINGVVKLNGKSERTCLNNLDFSKPNDINVNLINCLVLQEKLFDENLDMTEWMNFRSDYLVKEGGDNNLKYYYDNKGNIIKTTWQEQRGTQHWECELTINYLE